MHPKTEEFLYLLLWSTSVLLRPTFHNVVESFEYWSYGRGLFRQIAALQERKLVELASKTSGGRLCRLTRQGRLHALGGRDPQTQWSRQWDGRWRLVLFDVPVELNVQRERLRRFLRDRGFGCLQGSVWITPDPVQREQELLADGKVDVEALLLLEARPCAGETDSEIVHGAWDFRRINERYERYLKILDQCPTEPLRDSTAARGLRQWATEERETWLEAVTLDPLLPESLLPQDYLGRRAWRHRVKVLRQAGQLSNSFRL